MEKVKKMAGQTTDPIYRQTLLNAVEAIEIIVPMHIEAVGAVAERPADQVSSFIL